MTTTGSLSKKLAMATALRHTWGRSFSERVRGLGIPFEDRFRTLRRKKVQGKELYFYICYDFKICATAL